MATTTTTPPPSGKKVNRLGLELPIYRGSKTTLCAGCGHNAITERIIDAFFEMGVDQYNVAKFSGIGCSSKAPAYFLGQSHGFNGCHGRMAPVTTGAVLANKDLIAIGISGDGDTASIGMGHFIHLMRRNLPLIYIIENNGVYGLTKGQFSATADVGSKLKTGVINDLPPIDTCALAIELGATFVARSFSGDKQQLHAILKAAISHRGLAMIDIISPCTTFNDHVGSTKSYGYMKDHEEPIHGVEFVPFFEDIAVEYDEGTETDVKMFDGSLLRLKKLARDWNPTDKINAVKALHEAAGLQEVLTGVLYVEENKPTFIDMLNLVDQPLWNLPLSVTRPGKEVLDTVMEELQ
jgi:2-oxoglutarate ferredoxin oxidoreductase subunit beta